jgi:hypothetical protein
VIVFVLEPVVVDGRLMEPVLVFADPAEVKKDGAVGKWKHVAIQAAKPGRHLRVALTKNGAIRCIVHAIFR